MALRTADIVARIQAVLPEFSYIEDPYRLADGVDFFISQWIRSIRAIEDTEERAEAMSAMETALKAVKTMRGSLIDNLIGSCYPGGPIHFHLRHFPTVHRFIIESIADQPVRCIGEKWMTKRLVESCIHPVLLKTRDANCKAIVGIIVGMVTDQCFTKRTLRPKKARRTMIRQAYALLELMNQAVKVGADGSLDITCFLSACRLGTPLSQCELLSKNDAYQAMAERIYIDSIQGIVPGGFTYKKDTGRDGGIPKGANPANIFGSQVADMMRSWPEEDRALVIGAIPASPDGLAKFFADCRPGGELCGEQGDHEGAAEEAKADADEEAVPVITTTVSEETKAGLAFLGLIGQIRLIHPEFIYHGSQNRQRGNPLNLLLSKFCDIASGFDETEVNKLVSILHVLKLKECLDYETLAENCHEGGQLYNLFNRHDLANGAEEATSSLRGIQSAIAVIDKAIEAKTPRYRPPTSEKIKIVRRATACLPWCVGEAPDEENPLNVSNRLTDSQDHRIGSLVMRYAETLPNEDELQAKFLLSTLESISKKPGASLFDASIKGEELHSFISVGLQASTFADQLAPMVKYDIDTMLYPEAGAAPLTQAEIANRLFAKMPAALKSSAELTVDAVLEGADAADKILARLAQELARVLAGSGTVGRFFDGRLSDSAVTKVINTMTTLDSLASAEHATENRLDILTSALQQGGRLYGELNQRRWWGAFTCFEATSASNMRAFSERQQNQQPPAAPA